MHEALDIYFFDPNAVEPLALPGTVLDGLERGDPARPFVFLSVFKMEDRKGWRDLVKAFMVEFEGYQDVLLLLRT